jgi:hypothetical protein
MYPRWSIIYVGCCAQLSIWRFSSRFTKKPDFDTLKIQNTFFVGQNGNRFLWHSSPSQYQQVLYLIFLKKYIFIIFDFF